MVEFTQKSYGTERVILAIPDHYVALPQIFTSSDPCVTTYPDGRKIVKAGTIYPANDNTACGVVFHDYDVTNGDITGAVILHGWIKTRALPVIPTAAAKAALKLIQFIPLTAVVVTPTVLGALEIAVGEAADTEHDVVYEIEGTTFRPEANDLANWTITGESTTKVTVESIKVSPEGTYVTIHTKNSAAAVAGSITIIPKAVATATGDVPGSASTIATVA